MGFVFLALVMLMPNLAYSQNSDQGHVNQSCKWIHGRLSIYNGFVSFVFWPVGTKHRFAIVNCSSSPEKNKDEDVKFPKSVNEAFDPKIGELLGDFKICPLTPYKAGEMQFGCIADGRNFHPESSR